MAENLRQPPTTETKRTPRVERRGILLGLGGLVLLIILGLLGIPPVLLIVVLVAVIVVLLKIGVAAGRQRIDPDEAEDLEPLPRKE